MIKNIVVNINLVRFFSFTPANIIDSPNVNIKNVMI